MKIIIDIPDIDYEHIKEYYEKNDTVEATYSYIYHGTPLPKNHGDLIDKNELIKMYEKDCGRRIYADNFIFDLENNTTTILGADKEEEE